MNRLDRVNSALSKRPAKRKVSLFVVAALTFLTLFYAVRRDPVEWYVAGLMNLAAALNILSWVVRSHNLDSFKRVK